MVAAITLWQPDFVPSAYQTVLTYWAVSFVMSGRVSVG